MPPIDGLNSIDFLTSESVWDLKALPKRLLIIGADLLGANLRKLFHLGHRLLRLTSTKAFAERSGSFRFSWRAVQQDGVSIN